jgi:hypothetical protein
MDDPEELMSVTFEHETRPSAPSLLIVQPWFTAVGHPAQSLLNTAATLKEVGSIEYMVSIQPAKDSCTSALERLRRYGQVHTFSVRSSSVREGTLRALLKGVALAREERRYDHILFLDAHLVTLALVWPVAKRRLPARRTSMVYLKGPERVARFKALRWIVQRFLRDTKMTLFLRTEELVGAWRMEFPDVPPGRIQHLPTLEIPDVDRTPEAPPPVALLKFGVLGQVRRGKGLEFLLPLFRSDASPGILTVAGSFSSEAERRALSAIQGFEGFRDKFLTEDELLECAAQQNYLLMLYEPWDQRLEGAVLYLAARANRPVVSYGGGWCGRMIKAFSCGVIAPADHTALADFLRELPKPGTPRYESLLSGMERFRRGHSGDELRPKFLAALFS